MIGTIGTLTPAGVHSAGRSPRLSRATFLSFRPQPRNTPQHRFIRHHQRAALFPGFATLVQARRNTPPKQVRYPTDRKFVSSCSPPRLATTQLLSTKQLWLTPTGICTLLITRLHGRTLNRSRGRRFGQSGGVPLWRRFCDVGDRGNPPRSST